MVRKRKKRKKQNTGNKLEPKDDKQVLIALKAKLAKLESRASTGTQGEKKKPKTKVEGADKLPDAHPASGCSAPGTSSTLADKTERQELLPPNGMSVKELASSLNGHH